MTKSASIVLSVATAAAVGACVGLIGLTAITATANAQSVSSSTDYTADQGTKTTETGVKPDTKQPNGAPNGETAEPRDTSPYNPYSPKTARPKPKSDDNDRIAEPDQPKAKPRIVEPDQQKAKPRIAEPQQPAKPKKRVAAVAQPDSEIVKEPKRYKKRIRKSRRHRKSSHRRRYSRRSRSGMPAPGYEGFDGPGVYCSYRREPWRKCFNNRYGEYQCRTVGWRRIQYCY